MLRPDVAFVSDHILLDDIDEMKVYFYKIKNIFSEEEENREFIGVATIKNTTFPELVKMVKEDCSQFQEGYLDYTGYEHLSDKERDERYWEIDRKNLGWTYTPYIPEPEPTEEEKARKAEWEALTEDEKAELREQLFQEALEAGKNRKVLSEDEVMKILAD